MIVLIEIKKTYTQFTFKIKLPPKMCANTVSDKIKTTYGFDTGVYLVILAIISQYFT
jgi:hypothetical protein